MNSVSGVGVLDKSVLVLRSVADAPRSLAELEEATGLPRATAHRLANALVQHGLLRRDQHQRYDLGGELVALGQAARDRFPLVEKSVPVLSELRDATSESVQLFIVEGDLRRCVVSLPSGHALQWIVPEGALYPLAQGSAGRALVGEVGPQGWVATVAEREAGVASVSAPIQVHLGTGYRDLGQADDVELAHGVDGVGATGAGETLGAGAGAGTGAQRTDAMIIGAVSVSGPIERLGDQPGSRYGLAVVEAADKIAHRLA